VTRAAHLLRAVVVGVLAGFTLVWLMGLLPVPLWIVRVIYLVRGG
jgi:hypothetical protein